MSVIEALRDSATEIEWSLSLRDLDSGIEALEVGAGIEDRGIFGGIAFERLRDFGFQGSRD